MPTSPRRSLALLGACLILALLATNAAAAGPAAVTVRVEGLSETKLAPTQLTTTTTPVVKDGNPAHACSGPSALGALELASTGNWSGPWNGEFNQYEIYAIGGESHLFEKGAPANYYWSLWVDDREATVGACEAELNAGDRVLFFPACFGSACPAPPSPLEIEAPATAALGEPVQVTVKRFSSTGEASAAVGASVTGASGEATTDSGGHATVTFTAAGTDTLRVSAPASVRSEASVCVHTGADGSCGTRAAGPSGAGASTAPAGTGGVAGLSVRYTGPYALVAHAGGPVDGHLYARASAPKVLAGSVRSHGTVTSVSLELRRRYRGRCYSYDATAERFRAAHCGSGRQFKVSANGVYSYLLPAALEPGRYVLDVHAVDDAGNRTTLARGTSRIVFYVR
jgi:hypothetical protein